MMRYLNHRRSYVLLSQQYWIEGVTGYFTSSKSTQFLNEACKRSKIYDVQEALKGKQLNTIKDVEVSFWMR